MRPNIYRPLHLKDVCSWSAMKLTSNCRTHIHSTWHSTILECNERFALGEFNLRKGCNSQNDKRDELGWVTFRVQTLNWVPLQMGKKCTYDVKKEAFNHASFGMCQTCKGKKVKTFIWQGHIFGPSSLSVDPFKSLPYGTFQMMPHECHVWNPITNDCATWVLFHMVMPFEPFMYAFQQPWKQVA